MSICDPPVAVVAPRINERTLFRIATLWSPPPGSPGTAVVAPYSTGGGSGGGPGVNGSEHPESPQAADRAQSDNRAQSEKRKRQVTTSTPDECEGMVNESKGEIVRNPMHPLCGKTRGARPRPWADGPLDSHHTSPQPVLFGTGVTD